MSQVTDVLPQRVYVPTLAPTDVGRAPDVAVAHDLAGDGELFCYTSAAELRRHHGVATPWLRLCRADVEDVVADHHVVALHLDGR